jgi:hypothetical protein
MTPSRSFAILIVQTFPHDGWILGSLAALVCTGGQHK